jgi:hypothetical protein
LRARRNVPAEPAPPDAPQGRACHNATAIQAKARISAAAAKVAGTSRVAANASRVIQERRAFKKTCSARNGRPISSHTQKRPRHTNASPVPSDTER